MARSVRRTPIFGNSCARSEKQDKRLTSGIFRARTRTAMSADAENAILPVRRSDALDRWAMSKDGKHYWASAPASSMRK